MTWVTVDEWKHGRVWRDAKGRQVFYIRKRRGAKLYDVSTKCATARAAMRELERWELDPEGYQPLGVEDQITISEGLVTRYLAWCEASTTSRDPRWRRAKERYLKWWAEKLGDRSLARLPLAVILEALNGPPPATDRAKRIVALKHLYSWLRQTDQLKAADDPTLDALRVPAGRPAQDGAGGSKVIPEDDYRKVLALLDEPFADACIMMAGTGCHLSEVIRFASTGTVEPAPEGAPKDVGGIIGFSHKGGHWHRVPVSKKVAEAAARVRARSPLARESTYKAIRRACAAAKVPQWTPGRFRATFATRAVEAGTAGAAVAQYLGHKSQVTTLTWYATLAVPPKVAGME